nr:FecR domain-containing protein [uncultured Duganella sp.]
MAPATSDAGAPLPATVIDAAILWSVKLDYGEPSPKTRARFQHWLAADPLHALAWQRVATLAPALAAVPPALARDTLAAAERQHLRHSERRRHGLALLSLGGLAALLGWQRRDDLGWQRLAADASTAVGERRTLRLDDGSAIVLNTDSAVDLDFTAARRAIILRRGEIMVTTGADAPARIKRPFWVDTPAGAMRALGTRFVVRLDGDGGRARVGVRQGAVELHPAGAATALVRAGQAAWLAQDGATPAAPCAFAEDGFADGVIAGQRMRLDVLLRELARYRRGQVSCAPEVAHLPVSGVFHVADTDRVLRFLAQTLNLRVHYRTRFWVAVGPSGAPPPRADK